MKNKPIKNLTIKWNKKENYFGWKYPCRQGHSLGYEICKAINKIMEDPDWSDFDFKTLKLTIKVTPEKYEYLVKNPPEYR